MRHDGGLLIAFGAGLALLVAIWNWFSPTGFLAPLSSIARTPGAALMIAATLVLLVAGLVLGGTTTHRGLIGFLMIGAFFGILGTGLAGWLLDSQISVGLMAICAVGWLIRAFSRRRAHV